MLTWILLPIIIIADQLIKWWVVSVLPEFGTQTIIPHVVDALLIHNPGAFFGLFPTGNNVIAVLALITVCGIVVYLYLGKNIPNFLRIAFMLVAAGAIGNIIDRLVHNAVIDYICLKFIEFPIFNIADISITFGAAMLIWFVIWGEAITKNGD